jgi:putative transposase
MPLNAGRDFAVREVPPALRLTKPFPTVLMIQRSVSATRLLASHGIAISMDGKGAWRANASVERLWKRIKYEEVYLRACEGVAEARRSIGQYLDFYNGGRPHSILDDMTLDQAYFDLPPLRGGA